MRVHFRTSTPSTLIFHTFHSHSVTHAATVLANAYMHAGTSVDTFLRENLDWLSRATNWSKFR